MVRWQVPGDGKGQGGLMCCSPWDRKESNMTEPNEIGGDKGIGLIKLFPENI